MGAKYGRIRSSNVDYAGEPDLRYAGMPNRKSAAVLFIVALCLLFAISRARVLRSWTEGSRPLGQTNIPEHPPSVVLTPSSAANKIIVPQKVADLLIPILDLMSEATQKQPVDESAGSTFWRSSALLGRLFDNQSPAADEALVVLFSYYLGESNGEDLLQAVTERRRRMLPILRKYQCCTVLIPGRTYRRSMRLADSTRAILLHDAAELIEKGKTAGDN